jgi:hypothetical protein
VSWIRQGEGKGRIEKGEQRRDGGERRRTEEKEEGSRKGSREEE